MITDQDQQVPILTRLKRYWDAIGILTKILFFSCIFIFIVQLFWDVPTLYGAFNAKLILEEFQIWRLWTAAFLHGGIIHILFNMFSLFSLGFMLEKRMGTVSFFIATCILLPLSSLIHTIIVFTLFRGFGVLPEWYIQFGLGYSGVLFAYLVLSIRYYPEARNLCGFTIAPHLMPFIMLLFCQLIMMNVSFMGHLTGIIAGYIYFFLLKVNAYRRMIISINTIVPGFVKKLNSFIDFEEDGIDSVEGVNRYQTTNQGSIFSWIQNRMTSNRSTSQSQGRVLGRGPSNPRTTSSGHVEVHSETDDDLVLTTESSKSFPGEGRRLGSEN